MEYSSRITPKMIEDFRVLESNECPEVCSKCGRCCKTMGCEIYPQDVKAWFGSDIITVEMIYRLLNTGYIQLDWWEGDIRGVFKYQDEKCREYISQSFYLHMRNKCDAPIDGSWGGVCTALGDRGCIIPWDKRPTGGKALIPHTTEQAERCHAEVSKAECALAWTQYHTILEKVYNEYKIPEGENKIDCILKMLEDTKNRKR